MSASLTATAAQGQNLSTLLILADDDAIDVEQRMLSFTGIDDIAAQFGTNSPLYLAALEWFSQRPQPTELKLGRWAKTDSHGQLICAPLTDAQQVISLWNAIDDGAITLSINGTPQTVDNIDLSAATNLNGVASAINSEMSGATVAWDSINHRFVFTSSTDGSTSTVSFLTDPSSGDDLAAMLAGLSTTSGAYVADGIDAETAAAAAAIFDGRFGKKWYGLVILGIDDNDDHLAVAAFIDATTTKHVYGSTTQEAGCLVALNTTNLGYLMKAAGYLKAITQYSSTSPYAVVSALARILTTDWNGNNTTITLAYKDEPGVTAEELTETEAQALEGFNLLFFAEYDNDTAIINPPSTKTASGDWIDTIIGVDWLVTTVMTALYNILYTNTTKIPQTDAGMQILATGIATVCAQGVANGLLAPGIWTNGGFGALHQGDTLEKGFYIYAPPVALQSQSDRAARKSVLFQTAVKLGGAVHSADCSIVVNQ